MIKFLSKKDIDIEKWDSCIENCQNPLVYADSKYLDNINSHWSAIVKDDYKAVMPLFPAKKFGINYLTQPFYLQQSGVFSTEKTEFIRTEEFVSTIPDYYKFIDIQLNYKNLAPKIGQLKKIKRVNQVLDLNSSYENLYQRFSESHRKNIRRANKHQLIFEEFYDGEIFFNFKEQYKSGYPESHDTLKNIDAGLKNLNIVRYFGVKNIDKTWEVVAMFVEWKNRLTWLSSGTTEKGKDSKAMFMLVDNIIKKYSGTKLLLDFAGSSLPGVWYFNNGFGARDEVYYRITINKLHKIIRWLKR